MKESQMVSVCKLHFAVILTAAITTLSACSVTDQTFYQQALSLNGERIDQITPGAGITSSTDLLNERRQAETSKYYVPTITAVGFSSIAIQPSKKV